MNNKEEKKVARRGKRSPGYPMVSLGEAIQRLKILWEKDKNNPIPILAAYEHLGYKTIGGYGGRVLSALKQFGLISEKQGDIILTNEAVDLALHEPQDDIYIETVKKLAFKPHIYEKLLNEYSDGLPSDATLKIKLIKDYEFNPDKVDGFLSDFRRTIEYANLNKSDGGEISTVEHKVSINDNLRLKGAVSLKPSTFVAETNEREIAHYPIGQGLKARILVSGAIPVTSVAIKKLIGLLQLNETDLPEIADFDLNEENDTSKN